MVFQYHKDKFQNSRSFEIWFFSHVSLENCLLIIIIIIILINLFIFGCVGSLLLHAGFL